MNGRAWDTWEGVNKRELQQVRVCLGSSMQAGVLGTEAHCFSEDVFRQDRVGQPVFPTRRGSSPGQCSSLLCIKRAASAFLSLHQAIPQGDLPDCCAVLDASWPKQLSVCMQR